ncbi:MAG TPA: nucleoside triphosphate pyrophosphohydrolase family protein [Candidatus Bathyarchaeia archaeon]
MSDTTHRIQSFLTDVEDFHRKFELEYDGGPRELPRDLFLFRMGFMMEELAEYAISAGYTHIARQLNELHEHIKKENRWLTSQNEGGRNLEVQFDSLIDLAYVLLGTVHLHGVDFHEGWRRVHGANMKKVRVENLSDSKRVSKYDVVKPRGWTPPDLSDLVKEQDE